MLQAVARPRSLAEARSILGGNDRSGKYSLLSENDRTAIVQILRETKPGLPDYFR